MPQNRARPPGVHARPRLAPRRFSEALRIGAEVFHALKARAPRARALDRRRRRGRLRARSRVDRGGDRGDPRGSGARRAPRARSRSRSTRRRARSSRRRYRLPGEGRTLDPRGDDRLLGRPRRALPDRLDRGRARRRTTGDGWQTLTERARRAACSSSATTCSSRTSSVLAARASSEGVGERDPRQGQPDRHAHRDARRRSSSRSAAATRAVISHRSGETEDATIADLAVAHERRPDQDRRAVAHRSRREVQPAAADRGSAWRCRPMYPGWDAFSRAAASLGDASSGARRSSPRSARASSTPGAIAALDRGRHGRRPRSTSRTAPTTTTRTSARRVREAEAEAGRPIALIADLQGPKLRDRRPRRSRLMLDARRRCRHRRRGRRRSDGDLPISAGRARLRSPGRQRRPDRRRPRQARASTRMDERGELCARSSTAASSRRTRGVNLPGVPLPIPSLTEQGPRRPRLRARARGRLSSRSRSSARPPTSRRSSTLIEARRLAACGDRQDREGGGRSPLDEILDETDAVMVARGDLGVEIGAAEVPLAAEADHRSARSSAASR